MKCRAWDELNKVMHYDVEYITSGEEENDWIIFKSDKQTLKEGKVLDNPYFRKQIHLMYGALVEKSYNKELTLYAGDIISFSDEDGDVVLELISFDELYGLTVIGRFDEVPLCEVFDEMNDLRVLGNIHQNPALKELL